MKDERQIVIEYGSGSTEELLNIAAAGIAAMMYANQQSSKQRENMSQVLYDNKHCPVCK